MRPTVGHSDKQRRRFGLGLFLARQIPLQILDPPFIFPRRLTQLRRADEVPVICLFARGPPCRDMRLMGPALAAISPSGKIEIMMIGAGRQQSLASRHLAGDIKIHSDTGTILSTRSELEWLVLSLEADRS